MSSLAVYHANTEAGGLHERLHYHHRLAEGIYA